MPKTGKDLDVERERFRRVRVAPSQSERSELAAKPERLRQRSASSSAQREWWSRAHARVTVPTNIPLTVPGYATVPR